MENNSYLSIEEVKKILDGKKKALELIKEAEKAALEYLEKGEEIPGYKLVPALGNRKWTKDATLEALYNSFSHIIKRKGDFQETKIKSPAQLEKYFVELPAEKEKLEAFVMREDKGFKVVEA